MSWLTGLADRAENILNKLDQNAAAVLHENIKNNKTKSTILHEDEPRPVIEDPVISFPSIIKEDSVVDVEASSDQDIAEEEILAVDYKTEEDEKINLENAILKNEISVVHNELSILLSKTKNAEKATQNTQSRLAQMENSHVNVLKENEKLREKISQLQSNKSHEYIPDSFRTEKKNLEDKINELEFSIKSLNSLKNDLEVDLKSSRDLCAVLEEKLEKTKLEAANVLKEWKNYKVRVNNTLAAKEKMIETLGGNCGSGIDDAGPLLMEQISQLKIERDDLVDEISRLKFDNANKSKEVDELEVALRTNEKFIFNLKDALRQEKTLRDIAEHAVNNLNKELQSLQTETAKQISSLRSALKENKSKDSEKFSELNGTTYGSSESGDERFRSLTQALVAKQAALESITADRNALRLQLEKTENKYRSDLINMKNNQPRIINFNYTDDVKERYPSLLRESPWDSRLSRNVKKAYSSLDSFSVRIGVFLRRNPIARIFIIAYMVILHLWVLIVLCTYTPEAHS